METIVPREPWSLCSPSPHRYSEFSEGLRKCREPRELVVVAVEDTLCAMDTEVDDGDVENQTAVDNKKGMVNEAHSPVASLVDLVVSDEHCTGHANMV